MRRLILLTLVVVPLAFAPSATATPPEDASGISFITGTTITGVRIADGNTFVTATITRIIAGTLTGTISEEATLVFRSSGAASIKGIATCLCTVAGRSGTLVSRFEGTGETVGPSFDIHSGSIGGTGGLASLHAELRIQAVGGFSTYTGTFHFDP